MCHTICTSNHCHIYASIIIFITFIHIGLNMRCTSNSDLAIMLFGVLSPSSIHYIQSRTKHVPPSPSLKHDKLLSPEQKRNYINTKVLARQYQNSHFSFLPLHLPHHCGRSSSERSAMAGSRTHGSLLH